MGNDFFWETNLTQPLQQTDFLHSLENGSECLRSTKVIYFFQKGNGSQTKCMIFASPVLTFNFSCTFTKVYVCIAQILCEF